MQRSVIERWIDGLSERAFDQPFMALLRAHGFYDIHFTHGQYEFGKDFIAKRVEGGITKQYGFQSKAGDIAGKKWDAIHGQMEELVESWLVHPNYDATLEREHRLVLTGEVKGKAALSARQFKERLARRGEGNFEFWNRQALIDLIDGAHPEYQIKAPPESVERVIGKVLTGRLTRRELGLDLCNLVPTPTNLRELRESLVHNSLLCAQMHQAGSMIHAIRVSQNGARLAASLAFADPSDAAVLEVGDALRYCVDFAVAVVRPLLDMEPIDVAYGSAPAIGGWAAYPVVCSHIMEALGIAAIHYLGDQDGRDAEYAQLLAKFASVHPGAHRPLCDRSATSLVPAISAMAILGHADTAETLTVETTKWVCDQIQDGFGLAGPHADTKEQVERVFGSHFDFIDYPHKKDSLLGVALCDVAHVFLPHRYAEIVNEFKAVEARFDLAHPGDSSDALYIGRGDTQACINIAYPDSPDDPLPHHVLQQDERKLEVLGGVSLPLVIAALCGDRLFTDILPRLSNSASVMR